MIFEGLRHTVLGLQGRPGRFALQAAIAGAHVTAPAFDLTDWPRIVHLYDLLLAVEPSPVVDLNRAAAVAFADGPTPALAVVERLANDPRLRAYPYVHAVRADLLRRLDVRSRRRSRTGRRSTSPPTVSNVTSCSAASTSSPTDATGPGPPPPLIKESVLIRRLVLINRLPRRTPCSPAERIKRSSWQRGTGCRPSPESTPTCVAAGARPSGPRPGHGPWAGRHTTGGSRRRRPRRGGPGLSRVGLEGVVGARDDLTPCPLSTRQSPASGGRAPARRTRTPPAGSRWPASAQGPGARAPRPGPTPSSPPPRPAARVDLGLLPPAPRRFVSREPSAGGRPGPSRSGRAPRCPIAHSRLPERVRSAAPVVHGCPLPVVLVADRLAW